MHKFLTPSRATTEIRALAKNDLSDLIKTTHAEKRLGERIIFAGDLRHLLRNGFIYEEAKPIGKGLWKYNIESKTPNSKNRLIVATIIPDFKNNHIKIVTVFWKDKF